jgi:hypothetical protein
LSTKKGATKYILDIIFIISGFFADFCPSIYFTDENKSWISDILDDLPDDHFVVLFNKKCYLGY